MEENCKLDIYLETTKFNRIFDIKYSTGSMLNPGWFNANNFIFSYTENLNLKDDNVTKLPTSYFKNAGINPDNISEIMAFQLSTPYIKFSIDRNIGLLHKGNVLQELQRILIQFQQLNFTYNDYDLNDVYDELVLMIHHQTGLIMNCKELKEETIRLAKERFEESIEGIEIKCVKDAIHKLKLGKLKTHFVYTGGEHDGRTVLLNAIKKQESTINNAKIDDCINCMMDSDIYICGDTIEDQLHKTGRRQIDLVLKDRKQEIKDYNVSTFGVRSYKVYKQQYFWEIPIEN